MPWQRPWLRRRARKSGVTFQVVYWNGTKRIYSSSFPTEDLAHAHRSALEARLNGALPIGPAVPKPIDIPWEQAVTNWIASRPLKPRTRLFYKYVLLNFGKVGNVQRVSELNEGKVREILNGLLQGGLKKATITKYAAALNAFCPTAISKDLNFRRDFKPFRVWKRQRPVVYDEPKLRAIMDAALQIPGTPGRDGSWWHAFLGVLRHCGLRTDEAAHLIWADVSEELSQLTIQPHNNIPGVFEWTPKGKCHRNVPIPENLLVQLQKIPRPTPYIFLSLRRYRQLTRHLDTSKELPVHKDLLLHGLPQQFRKIRKRAGICEGTLHDFRRTFITNWLRELPPHEVQILAGHEDVKTTLGIYAEVQAQSVVEKAKLLMRPPCL